MGWSTPQNGFETRLLFKVLIQWVCTDCSYYGRFEVLSHPLGGGIRAVRWPSYEMVSIGGMESWVCPPLPVEHSTWGRVKMLYQDSLAN